MPDSLKNAGEEEMPEYWRELEELVIEGEGAKRMADFSSESGAVGIDARHLSEMPTTLGGGDALSLIKTLPAVATPSDLQAVLPVHGLPPAYTRFSADGIRLANPLHLLGLYSAFNPAVFENYRFVTSGIPAVIPSEGGALLEAESGREPARRFGGKVSVGLIESHCGLRIPVIKDKLSITAGARQSYLNLLFPDILTLGKSHLKYGFTDAFLSVKGLAADGHYLTASVVYSRDGMRALNGINGGKDADFGWSNLGGSVRWRHGRWEAGAYVTDFRNKFRLDEGGISLDLPSRLTEVGASGSGRFGDFTAAMDARYISVSGMPEGALEVAPAVQWERSLGQRWNLRIGVRGSVYVGTSDEVRVRRDEVRVGRYEVRVMSDEGRGTSDGGGGYTGFFVQPRVAVDFRLAGWGMLYASYGRQVKFVPLVEESAVGLPLNFFTLSTREVRPEDVHSMAMGIRGTLPFGQLGYCVEGYANRMLHVKEFAGALTQHVSPNYDPLTDLLSGTGWSYGVSVALTRSVGAVRGTAGYTLGKSRLRFDRYGAQAFPSAHDRLHDFTATVAWQPWGPLVLSASFVHATGLPYTKAKFGYMIGENLICEYWPHNSSRLPAYNRLDLSATLTFRSGGRGGSKVKNGLGQNQNQNQNLKHEVNVSVYNAAACRNVLFTYPTYSVGDGLQQRESVMRAVIPSLTYTLSFE